MKRIAKFEKVSRFSEIELEMPARKTAFSAGYDLSAAEDTVIPSYLKQMNNMSKTYSCEDVMSLETARAIYKEMKSKPTLVSTGMKCALEPNTYLELSVRSSTPLKTWLVLANSKGIIDADYYNNPDNEGEIFVQMINLSPFDVLVRKGERLAQGIIHRYEITEDDAATGARDGGFGSTGV